MLALGFDLSTQSCKCVAVDAKTMQIVASSRIHYDSKLSEYKTENGVHRHPDGRVTSPTEMWADALQKALLAMDSELRSTTAYTLQDVVVLSGSAQQHATVYWNIDVDSSSPAKLDPRNVGSLLSTKHSPVWLDDSTTRYCCRLRSGLPGGDRTLCAVTGSRATERFSIHHVAALRDRDPASFAATKSVGLASSFATSLFVGHLCGVDYCDAAGTNAFDIQQMDWFPQSFEALGLDRRLFAPVVDPTCIVGTVGSYWREALQISRTAFVVPFSGDNPCAVVGMGLFETGDVVVSLGTSDTCILVAPCTTTSVEGVPFAHTFPHPLFPNDLKCHMLVYANGDLGRRRVRDAHFGGDWGAFSASLGKRPIDAVRRAGAMLATNEISPPIAVPSAEGIDVLLEDGVLVQSFSDPDAYSRVCIEYTALTMRQHLTTLLGDGLGRLLITGGASVNQGILDTFAHVFQRDVWVLQMTPDAAAYGGALRGLWASASEVFGMSRTQLQETMLAHRRVSKAATAPTSSEGCPPTDRRVAADLEHIASLLHATV